MIWGFSHIFGNTHLMNKSRHHYFPPLQNVPKRTRISIEPLRLAHQDACRNRRYAQVVLIVSGAKKCHETYTYITLQSYGFSICDMSNKHTHKHI